jgi:hypothetical protein
VLLGQNEQVIGVRGSGMPDWSNFSFIIGEK